MHGENKRSGRKRKISKTKEKTADVHASVVGEHMLSLVAPRRWVRGTEPVNACIRTYIHTNAKLHVFTDTYTHTYNMHTYTYINIHLW